MFLRNIFNGKNWGVGKKKCYRRLVESFLNQAFNCTALTNMSKVAKNLPIAPHTNTCMHAESS